MVCVTLAAQPAHEAGKVVPVIDRRYRLSEVADAVRYLEGGLARGKVIITLEFNRT
ncbi:MAG: zinc-binding dehydrogenase [Chloroflexi bacterium]|nr:zinc-binding dehydrogenase [Chloroflexota bacterium]